MTKHKYNKTRGWETFVNFTTRGSSVVKTTCIFRFTRVPTSASVFCACAPYILSHCNYTVSLIQTQEQDMECPTALRTGDGGLKIFDG